METGSDNFQRETESFEPSDVLLVMSKLGGSIMLLVSLFDFSNSPFKATVGALVGTAFLAWGVLTFFKRNTRLTVSKNGLTYEALSKVIVLKWSDIRSIRIGFFTWDLNTIARNRRLVVKYWCDHHERSFYLMPVSLSTNANAIGEALIKFCPNQNIARTLAEDIREPAQDLSL